MNRKVKATLLPGQNPHCAFSRDTDSENQFDPAFPWFGRVKHLFESIPDGAWVLDCGCNSGGFGATLLARKPHCILVGVDLAAHLLPLAEAKGYRLTHAGPAEDLSWLPDSSFHVAVLSEILEHADDPDACVREAVRVLVPGGLLLGDVPSCVGRWGWRTIRGHRWHQRVFTKRGLRNLLTRWSEVEEIRYAYADLRAGYALPQWVTFRCRKSD